MDVYASPPTDADALASELSQTVTRFRRALQRSARANFDSESLSPTEVELLLLVGERPGTGVAAAATELGAAPNTVSTLIRKLVSVGLLRREFSRGDRRVARLLLTEEAEGRVDRWKAQRAESLSDLLTHLPDDDRERLRTAVPVLEALSAALYQPRRRGRAATSDGPAPSAVRPDRSDAASPTAADAPPAAEAGADDDVIDVTAEPVEHGNGGPASPPQPERDEHLASASQPEPMFSRASALSAAASYRQ